MLAHMYYRNRAEAGEKLAERLLKYQAQNCTVVALNDGAVIVGSRIAAALKCPITLLLVQDISIPGEFDPYASMNQDGGVAYNSKYSESELEDFKGEYHQYIEQEKLDIFYKLAMDLDSTGLIRHDLLRGRYVIMVSDGLNGTYELDAAAYYLKPVKTKKLIVATPLADINAVDRMHLLADEVICLDVVDNYIETNHYYDENNLPDHHMVLKSVRNIVSAAI
ncbi:MAG: phosphoribosyltransferase [Candidatus Saccharibacteria bacterium]|nr:phosphoribosyltransferase [Candidatus Saccharibacteria bacterium]